MKKLFRRCIPVLFFLKCTLPVFCQDTLRTQYPGFLKNAYFNFNFGYINFPFSSKHLVWMHSGTISLKGQVPISKKFSAYGEAGLAIFSRRGFKIDNSFAVKDYSYSSVLLGAGVEYHTSPKWGVLANFNFAPGNSENKQPYEIFYSAGLRYNLTPIQ